jgi:hypothetical protein
MLLAVALDQARDAHEHPDGDGERQEGRNDQGGRQGRAILAEQAKILDDADARRHEQDAEHGEQAVGYFPERCSTVYGGLERRGIDPLISAKAEPIKSRVPTRRFRSSESDFDSEAVSLV